MPDIAPFRGLRFNADQVEPSSAICPPYDVIDAAQHARLLAHDPHNAVRWILGDDPETPFANEEEYKRRAALVASWESEGALVLDEEPAFYLYEMDFRLPEGGTGRYRGILAAVEATPWEDGRVLPHEEIRPKVVEDRLALLRATKMNMGVVQLAVDDRAGKLDAILEGAPRVLLFEGRDWNDEGHRLEAITDAKTIAAIQEWASPETAIVADGHHRYTTAVLFRKESDLPGANRALAMIGDLFQGGVRIYATHRLLVTKSAAESAELGALIRTQLNDGDGLRWSVELPNGDRQELSSRADVSVPTLSRRLQALLDEHGGEVVVETFHDEAAARERAVELGDRAVVCWMPPVGKDEFWDRCSQKEVFPPKTTYFLPKVCTGILARQLTS